MTNAYTFAEQHFETSVQQLIEWLRIPSVSTDPTFKGDIERAAEWLAADMRRVGLDNVAVMPTGGHPVVYGEWLKAGADKPTVLIYGHYDVQPAVLEDGWKHDPFAPEIRDGRVWARGSCDDKGQVMVQLKAAEALLASGGSPVNLKYLIEGEEESSSVHLSAFLAQNKDLLKADICLISDTGVAALDQPSINYSLRGLVAMEVIVSGPRRDMHSGYGGIVHNPAQAIAEIVAQLHKPDGSVAVPGFYDDVYTPTEAERELLKKAEIQTEEWRNMMGDMPEWGEAGYLKIERVGIRPTLEINGIYGGYAGDGFKTVIPAKSLAKISCRLVANQDPDKIAALVEAYIKQLAPNTVQVEVRQLGGGKFARTPIEHPAVQAAVRAYQSQWEKEVIFVPGGGSIPVVADFQSLLGLPVVLMGFSLPDGGAHGPNESFHLDMYRKGIATIIAFMNEYATAG